MPQRERKILILKSRRLTNVTSSVLSAQVTSETHCADVERSLRIDCAACRTIGPSKFARATFARFRAPSPPSKIARQRPRRFCASFSRTRATPTASASRARREQGRARSSTASRATIAARRKPSASSPLIPRARSRAARFLATAFACKAMPPTPGIFIRSMATRGYLGGLAQTTGDVALLLDAAGKANDPRRDGRRRPGRN